MQGENFQDWTPVVLNKTNKVTTTSNKSGPKKQLSQEESKNRKLENEEYVPKFVGPTLAKSFVAKRVQMKLTQKQLAQQVNIDVKIISEIETGKRVFNNSEISKCERVLGKLR
jgi:putative transcription factor